MLATMMLVSGCVGIGGGADCSAWRAIQLDDASIDGLTARDARDILVHNVTGQKLGCWR